MILDRLLQAVEALVRAATSKIDYLGLYPCRVVAQNADGTLELQPDDTRLPPLSGVTVFSGVAGAEVQVTAGARVLAGFGGGDPSRPFAALWEPGSATIVFNGGTAGVGRVGDAVKVTIPPGTTLGANGGGNLTTTAPIDITGTITAGSHNVKA